MATEHPKTRAMNIVGGIGLTVMGIAQFFHKMAELPVEMLAAIVAFWLALVLVAVGTARALSANTSPALRTTMFWANWALIGLWCFGVAGRLLLHQPLLVTLLIALFFVVPEWINIRALRQVSKPANAV